VFGEQWVTILAILAIFSWLWCR